MISRLKIDSEHIKVEEDKLKIVWAPAGIEKWLIGQLITHCTEIQSAMKIMHQLS